VVVRVTNNYQVLLIKSSCYMDSLHCNQWSTNISSEVFFSL